MTITPSTSASTFGQRIEAALVAAWSDAREDGAALLASADAFGARELGVVENAIIQTWNAYEPKAAALLQTYAKTALSELGFRRVDRAGRRKRRGPGCRAGRGGVSRRRRVGGAQGHRRRPYRVAVGKYYHSPPSLKLRRVS